MGETCYNCGSSEFDDENGSSICTSCGTVLVESGITDEVAFQETRGGGAQAIGTFVKEGSRPENSMGLRGIGSESREQTFAKGKKKIQEIASQLRINQGCIDEAFNWFKMCVTRNFTRGRPRSYVAAACLYVNVYDLGRVLTFLTRSLSINLPATDPCLYILRFAHMLDVGEKQKDVIELATRIVNRMKRDWLGLGRRPTGLCGAALLLASRAHNYNRSVADIVRIVHISESVVRKRLDEFASTPSGSLSIEDFNNVDLEHNEDPPAFQETRKRFKEAQENAQLDEYTKQIEPFQREIEDELKKRMKNHPFAKMIVDVNDEDIPELSNAAEHIRDEVINSVYEEIDSPISNTITSFQAAPGPSLQSLGIFPSNRSNQLTIVNPWNVERDDGNLDLTGIDDKEIESYLLTESESQNKERLWMARNSHHLKEMERKRKLKEEEEEKERENPKKKRKTIRKKDEINAATPGEAMVQVIHEKKLSNKINYDVLREDDNWPAIPEVSQSVFDSNLPVISEVSQSVFDSNLPTISEVSQLVFDSNLPAIPEVLQSVFDSNLPAIPEVSQSVFDSNKDKLAEISNPPARRLHIKARPNIGKAAK